MKQLRDGHPTTLLDGREAIAFSANGRWLLSRDATLNDAACKVWLTDLLTEHERPLEAGCDFGGYDWAPRGNHFTLTDGHTGTVSVINARTGATRMLGYVDTEWSPDGRRLLVMRNARARVLDVWTGRSSPPCGEGTGAEWSPAGRMVLVFNGKNERTTLCARSGRLISRLSDTDYSWTQRPSRLMHTYTTKSGTDSFAVSNRFGRASWRVRNASEPTWSRHGRVAWLRAENTVWVARSGGRSRHKVAKLPRRFEVGPYAFRLTWTPDGKSVIASQYDYEFLDHPQFSYIASIRGGGFRDLKGSLETFSPDGHRIVVESGDGLYGTDAQGRHRHRLATRAANASVQQVEWPASGR